MKQIPNLFTLLNLVFGCIAIIFTLQNGIILTSDTNGAQLVDIPEKIWMASLFIGLAAIVDFADGFVARMFHASSEMGKQLDSLADLVSFGVAPAMIMYQFLRLSYAQEETGMDVPLLFLFVSLLLPAAAAYRLARFNLDAGQAYTFKGLPVPATGIFVASLPLIYWNVNEKWIFELILNKWFLYGVIVLLSYLMVSTLPMMSLKFKDYSIKNNLAKYILAVVAIVSIVVLKWLAIPVIFLVYVVLSLTLKNKSHDLYSAGESDAA
jgi:CDP-diacylglycerol---serine O-phosphatidyltransferase